MCVCVLGVVVLFVYQLIRGRQKRVCITKNKGYLIKDRIDINMDLRSTSYLRNSH